MVFKHIINYQVSWNARQQQGYFWFHYADGHQEQTAPLDAENFRILYEILRHEASVYGDHTVPLITTRSSDSNNPYPVPLIELSSSDRVLSCFINFYAGWPILSRSNDKYFITRDSESGEPILAAVQDERRNRLKDDLLITDMSITFVKGLPDTLLPIDTLREIYEASRKVMEQEFPQLFIGNYLSGTCVKPQTHLEQPYLDEAHQGQYPNHVAYPIPRLPAEYFTHEDLSVEPNQMGGFFPYRVLEEGQERLYYHGYLNYTNPQTAQKLVQYTLDQVRQRNVQLLYSDNWTYPGGTTITEVPVPPWADAANYLCQLRHSLNANGIRLITNIAWAIGNTNSSPEQELADVELLAQAVDGLTLEQPLHVNILNDLDKLKHNIKVLRKMLNAGLWVGLMASSGLTAEFLAAWAMIVRKPGDKLFVNKNVNQAKPDWMSWPEKFGSPKHGEKLEKVNGEIIVSREFEHGKIILNLTTKKLQLVP